MINVVLSAIPTYFLFLPASKMGEKGDQLYKKKISWNERREGKGFCLVNSK